jgi:uncharacterized protein (TIGR02600 family)
MKGRTPPSGSIRRAGSQETPPGAAKFLGSTRRAWLTRAAFDGLVELSMKRMTRTPKQGVALVIVLAFLVLIAGIVLAFFSSVSTELAASKVTAVSATTHQLADSAVNVVMAQLVDATKGQEASSGTLAWASQPGLIRTFDQGGKAKNFYKLYSSDQMVVDGSTFSLTDELPPPAWNSPANSAYYTDLNAPAIDAKGLLIYPILDPAADGGSSPGRTPDGFKVEGFSITSPPGFIAGTTESSSNNRAPMPVKWIYVLKDGSLHPPTDPGAGTVTVKEATADNPIVGRIAFWADDETAKVNINTASEGVYWDAPRIFSMEDVGMPGGGFTPGTVASTPGLGLSQPANREYQRYPGHPATTSLSAVFGTILPSPVPAAVNNYNYASINQGNAVQLDAYYNIAPRVGLATVGTVQQGGGGSKGGTQIPLPITLDSDRLYASVDELMFTPTISGTARMTNTGAVSSPTKPNVITKAVLEKARFFITANSSAPDVTLYNTPRIGIWPVNIQPANQTAFDKLAAFCGTINAGAYYFTRQNARSATDDFNPRNQALYHYLQALTSTPVPGFGGTFAAKYPAGPDGVSDRDQILTSIFDYVRSTNLSDTTAGAKPYTPLTNFNNRNLASTAGAGEVIPIRIQENNTQGFGRFDTVTEFDLLFYGTSKLGTTTRAATMRTVVMLKFGSPMQGNVGYQPNLKYRITGLETLKVTDAKPAAVSLNLPANGTNIIEVPDNQTCHGRSFGGIEGPAMAFTNKALLDVNTSKRLTTSGGEARGNYPFFSSSDITLGFKDTDNVKTFALSAGTIKIEVIAVDTGYVVQTLTFQVPATPQVKIPDVSASYPDFNRRLDTMMTNWGNWTLPVQGEDTVIGLELAGTKGNDATNTPDNTAGDMRITAARQTVDSAFFRPHLNWANSVNFSGKAYGQVVALGLRYPGATSGSLAANANYMNGDVKQPGIPSRVPVAEGVRRADGKPGDWDTGIGLQKDGAYINKADEGDQQFSNYLDGSGRIPYVTKDDFFQADGTIFSPNRQVSSPMMFGGIPTGVHRNLPWQTLLFHSRPEDPTHPGFGTPKAPAAGQSYTKPPDHLLADLFWMPIVEPWAISQPFATAGRINMNYQIIPFTYIRRSTGMNAVMKGTRFMALQTQDALTYKPHITSIGAVPNAPNRRYAIDATKTLEDFDLKFKNNDVFKSATQICDMNLVPPGQSSSSMAAFWNQNQLTGDNLREKPYSDIYPRLTTKSNTFTVHVRVQALKKVPGSDPTKWDSAKDKVVGEYRGASILERYIDPNDPSLPDFATKFAASPSDPALNIDQYYKMRVVSTKRFAP